MTTMTPVPLEHLKIIENNFLWIKMKGSVIFKKVSP